MTALLEGNTEHYCRAVKCINNYTVCGLPLSAPMVVIGTWVGTWVPSVLRVSCPECLASLAFQDDLIEFDLGYAEHIQDWYDRQERLTK